MKPFPLQINRKQDGHHQGEEGNTQPCESCGCLGCKIKGTKEHTKGCRAQTNTNDDGNRPGDDWRQDLIHAGFAASETDDEPDQDVDHTGGDEASLDH